MRLAPNNYMQGTMSRIVTHCKKPQVKHRHVLKWNKSARQIYDKNKQNRSRRNYVFTQEAEKRAPLSDERCTLVTQSSFDGFATLPIRVFT